MLRRLLVVLALGGVPAWAGAAWVAESYLAAGQFDLLRLLPPPA